MPASDLGNPGGSSYAGVTLWRARRWLFFFLAKNKTTTKLYEVFTCGWTVVPSCNLCIQVFVSCGLCGVLAMQVEESEALCDLEIWREGCESYY